MDVTTILTCLTILSSLCAIFFGFKAYARNKKKDEDSNTVSMASMSLDLKYIRDNISSINNKMSDIEKSQNVSNVKIAKFEEHLQNVDERLDKLEKLTGGK